MPVILFMPTNDKRLSGNSQAPFFPIHHGFDARYSIPCPKCGAATWSRCNSRGVASRYIHASRTLDKKPEVRALPAFVNWWRSMKRYEGERPQKRPSDLEVPTQAELVGAQA